MFIITNIPKSFLDKQNISQYKYKYYWINMFINKIYYHIYKVFFMINELPAKGLKL